MPLLLASLAFAVSLSLLPYAPPAADDEPGDLGLPDSASTSKGTPLPASIPAHSGLRLRSRSRSRSCSTPLPPSPARSSLPTSPRTPKLTAALPAHSQHTKRPAPLLPSPDVDAATSPDSAASSPVSSSAPSPRLASPSRETQPHWAWRPAARRASLNDAHARPHANALGFVHPDVSAGSLRECTTWRRSCHD